MKKIGVIIFFALLFFPETNAQENFKNTNCDSLLAIKSPFLDCFGGESNWNLLRTVDCYKENNQLDRAIEISESNARYIDDTEMIFRAGWTNKLLELYNLKFGRTYMLNELANATIHIDIEDIWMEVMPDLIKSVGFEWEQYVLISVRIFKKDFYILSTIETQENDYQILKEFVTLRLPKDEVISYFEKRWSESPMYLKIENL